MEVQEGSFAIGADKDRERVEGCLQVVVKEEAMLENNLDREIVDLSDDEHKTKSMLGKGQIRTKKMVAKKNSNRTPNKRTQDSAAEKVDRVSLTAKRVKMSKENPYETIIAEASDDASDRFDQENMKMEMEDAMMFGSDAWLKHCVEMEEEESSMSNIKEEVKNIIDYQEKAVEDSAIEPMQTDDRIRPLNIKNVTSDEKEKSDCDPTKKVVAGTKNSNRTSNKRTQDSAAEKVEKRVSSTAKRVKKSKENPYETIIAEANVSKTADTRGCSFSCSKCPTIRTSWFSLRQHMKRSHNETLSPADIYKHTKQATVHECKICSKKILCDSAFLIEHMRLHSISIIDYRQKYGCDVAWKTQQRELLEKGRLSENEIGNMCTYRCLQCKRIFYAFKSLACHGSNCKQGALKIFRNDIGKYILQVAGHKCKICSTMLFCDLGLIMEHMTSTHGIKTPKEYALKVGGIIVQSEKETALKNAKKTISNAGNFCTFACQKCGHTFKSWNATQYHLKKKNHWSASGRHWCHYITDTVVHECKICKKELLNDKYTITSHVNIHQETFKSYVDMDQRVPMDLSGDEHKTKPPWGIGGQNHSKKVVCEKNSNDTSNKSIEECLQVVVKEEAMLANKICRENMDVSGSQHKTKPLMGKGGKNLTKKVVAGKNSHRTPNKSTQDSVAENMVDKAVCSTETTDLKHRENTYKSLIAKANVSKTADTRGCWFSCSKCPITMTSWGGLRAHMKRSHNEFSLKADVHKYTTQATVHECYICSEKVLCDSAFLIEHMRLHSIAIADYRHMYGCDVAWKCQQRELLEKGRLSEDKIGDMCTYRCLQCKRIFSSFHVLANHGPNCKQGSLKIWIHDLSKYILQVVGHTCKICSTMLFCDLRIISLHMTSSHRIKTPKEYTLQVGGVIVQSEKDTALKNAKKTISDAGNFCTYACHKCGHTSKSWDTTLAHLKKKDHWSTSGRQWRHYITDTVVHECKICKKELLNDKFTITSHVKAAHQETFKSYADKYN